MAAIRKSSTSRAIRGDDTYEECLRVQKAYKGQWDIKVLRQDGKGKGDAVRKGFDNASGDILMVLDADLTVPPAALPKFYRAIASGKGEFINGTRLVYPMEDEAMRFLNHIANRTFAKIFSYLLNQRFTDTLCGTKVLTRTVYGQIVAGRDYFGDFDPFGDFDLIFGAAKQSRAHNRGARTLQGAHLRRNTDLALPGWLAVAPHGALRVQEAQGDLMLHDGVDGRLLRASEDLGREADIESGLCGLSPSP